MDTIPNKEWKAKYGKIYKVTLETKTIYFRLLNAGELIGFRGRQTSDIAEEVSNLVVLNNESLSLAGSQVKLSDFAIKNSFPSDDKALEERILHHRYKAKDDFLLLLIAKLCSVFVSYTPDTLKGKTVDQLMELMSIAELITGKDMLSKKGKLNPKAHVINPETKWSKPDPDALMEQSSFALKELMTKQGKTIKEFKPKTKPKSDNPMHAQMNELGSYING